MPHPPLGSLVPPRLFLHYWTQYWCSTWWKQPQCSAGDQASNIISSVLDTEDSVVVESEDRQCRHCIDIFRGKVTFQAVQVKPNTTSTLKTVSSPLLTPILTNLCKKKDCSSHVIIFPCMSNTVAGGVRIAANGWVIQVHGWHHHSRLPGFSRLFYCFCCCMLTYQEFIHADLYAHRSVSGVWLPPPTGTQTRGY